MPSTFARAVIGALLMCALTALLTLASMTDATAQDRYASERKTMLDEIVRTTRETAAETGRAVLSERVLAALERVPRHRLVPPSEAALSYRNRPLPIGLGQTISQPFIVAIMTDLLDVRRGDRVLEIGTGSGYQAAVLAEMGADVYTIEIVEPLAREAARRLMEMGYTSVRTRIGDGYGGWLDHAPFDAIIVTAAPRAIPPALIEQLKPGGKLVIPIGEQQGAQTLYVVDKGTDGRVLRRPVLAVRFVPLTGSTGGTP